MNRAESAVVVTMQQASLDSWRAWRRLVEAGQGDTPEAQELWESSQLSARVFLDELAGRERLAQARRKAAVDDAGPEADLGLAAALELARAAA